MKQLNWTGILLALGVSASLTLAAEPTAAKSAKPAQPMSKIPEKPPGADQKLGPGYPSRGY